MSGIKDPADGRANPPQPPLPLDDDALDWAIRMGRDDADWDAFTAWLERDPARAELYDRAATALMDATAVVAEVPEDGAGQAPARLGRGGEAIPRRTAQRWSMGLVAAGLVAALGIGTWHQLPRPYEVSTPAGAQRTVTLEDGSSIVLAGGTRLRLDRSDTRSAVIEQGEALFHVRHDAGRPFEVRARDLRLVDLGTTFDVKLTPGGARVEVSEGVVMVDPEGAAVRLAAGQGIVAAGASLQRRPVDAAEVGAWREGRLGFDEAPLPEVAADLTRQLGTSVEVAPEVAGRTFSGTLDARTLRNRPELLSALLGVHVRRGVGGWRLEAPH